MDQEGTAGKISRIAAYSFGLVLVGYIAFLVVSQYRFQIALQHTTLQQLTHDSEKQSTALSYFFAEREDDLRNLAESRELTSYFENLALGMSFEYGLRSSMDNVNLLFQRTRKKRLLDGKPIYKRIVFIDASGRLLNDSDESRPPLKPEPSWRTFLTPGTSSHVILVDRSQDKPRIIISMPCTFKGRYAGQVLGWVSSSLVFNYFIEDETGTSQHPVAVAFGREYLYVSSKAERLVSAGAANLSHDIQPGIPYRLPPSANRSRSDAGYAVLVPVSNTPLSLLMFLPASNQLDISAPRRLLYTTGGMALFVLAGMFFFQRLYMRNALLKAHLRDTTLREQAVEEKNRQLADEVSERIRAERELWENRELLRAVIDGTSDAVYVKDLNGRYLLFNAAACLVTGKAAGEVIGRDDSVLFPPHEARMIMEHDRSVLASGKTVTIEENVTDAAGSRRTFLATKGPLVDATGNVNAMFGIARDISEIKRAEEALLRSNDELEKRVRERTAEYEEINRELESFCYSVSHDMRAPVRHIDGYTRIFLEEFGTTLNSSGRDYLDKICLATKRMGSLIDDLLNLARISRSAIEVERIDLSELAREICSSLQTAAPQRVVTCVITPGISCYGDQNLMRIVLENLLDNAWKYTKHTERAEIEFGIAPVDGRRVPFIRDNGTGFDMAYAGKLFGVFQRLHKEEEYEGTGVGLAIVKRILQLHGGEIWYESRVNEGTTFYFTTTPSVSGGDKS